jgi:hypothetical protein
MIPRAGINFDLGRNGDGPSMRPTKVIRRLARDGLQVRPGVVQTAGSQARLESVAVLLTGRRG